MTAFQLFSDGFAEQYGPGHCAICSRHVCEWMVVLSILSAVIDWLLRNPCRSGEAGPRARHRWRTDRSEGSRSARPHLQDGIPLLPSTEQQHHGTRKHDTSVCACLKFGMNCFVRLRARQSRFTNINNAQCFSWAFVITRTRTSTTLSCGRAWPPKSRTHSKGWALLDYSKLFNFQLCVSRFV